MAAATQKVDEPKQASAVPVAQYINMDEVSRYVASTSNIDLENMPATFEQSGRYQLPIVDPNKTRKLDIGKGREKDVPVDIQWANRNKFTYAWLDEPTANLPQFAGYTPLVKDCPAAYAYGKHIPDRYFGGKNFISVGNSVLHFAKKSFAQSVKETTNAKALRKLNGLTPGQSTASFKDDETGGDAGGVRTKEFSSGGFSEEE